LDTIYPSAQAADFTDSPVLVLDISGTSMFTAVGEKSENVQFITYLMWDPQVPVPGESSCHPAESQIGTNNVIGYSPSTCASIPVPIASLTWGFAGDAIKTLNPTQGEGTNTWILSCGSAQTPAYGTGTPGFPNWSNTVNPSQLPQ
jgi:hypothetical protein